MASENFAEKTEMSDLILLVENKKLHVNKTLLMLASPVFRKMLTSDFKEKTAEEIPLPGKKYHQFIAFLRCIYPDTADDITLSKACELLPLAEEYQCCKIKTRCENYLKEVLFKNTNADIAILCLVAAEAHDLKGLFHSSTDVLSNKMFSVVKKKWNEVSAEGRLAICTKRVEKLERFDSQVADSIRSKDFAEYFDADDFKDYKKSLLVHHRKSTIHEQK